MLGLGLTLVQVLVLTLVLVLVLVLEGSRRVGVVLVAARSVRRGRGTRPLDRMGGRLGRRVVRGPWLICHNMQIVKLARAAPLFWRPRLHEQIGQVGAVAKGDR